MRTDRNGALVQFFSKNRSVADAFECLFENASDSVFILDLRGKFVAVNRMAEQLTGFRQADYFVGKPLKDVIPTASLPNVIKNFWEATKGKVTRFELEFKTATHKNVIAEVILTPCVSKGRTVGVFGIARDITERKRMEKALQDSRKFFETIIESTPLVAIQGFDRDGRILHWNNMSTRLYGFSREEVLGKNAEQFLLGARCIREFKRVLREIWNSGKAAPPREWLVGTKSGEKCCIYSSMFPILKQGKVAEVICMDLDLTERKTSEQRLSALNSYAGRLNAAQSRQQVYELTLDAMEQTLGFENAAFMIVEKGSLKVGCQRGCPEPSLALPLDGTKKGITVKSATTRKPVLVSDVKNSHDYVEGNSKVKSELAVPVEIEGRILGVLDVESKKLAAFDEKDVTLLQVLASHAATALSNLEKREEIEKRSVQLTLLMKSSAEMIHSTDLHKRLQKIAEAIREHGWRRVVIRAVRGENMEVTRREDMVTSGLTNVEREFLWTNRMPGQVWRERFGPDYERFKIGEFYHLPWNDPWVRKKFAEGTVPSKLTQKEMVDWDPQDLLYAPLRLADGRIVGVLSIDDPVDGRRPTKNSLAPLELFIHQSAVAIENAQLFRDLDDAKNQIKEYADQLELKVKQRTQELVEAQNKLIKTERLAAIGEVAAMVGHDLRNPLTGITGATYYLKMKLGSKMSKKALEMLEIIEKDIEYSNKIVNDLLEYSKEIRLEMTETNPRSMVKDALAMVKIPANIHVVNATRREPKMRIDVEKMKRVLINITKNAVDAMPTGGTLAIKCTRTDSKVEIIFADNGMGMSDEVLDKLWSPLFTTKARGMGFGLPICKRVVEAHGGNILVESTVGKGTTFTITIPIRQRVERGGKIWVNMPEFLLSTMTKA